MISWNRSWRKKTSSEDYVVPRATLTKLGHGDAAKGRRLLRAIIDLETDTLIAPAPAEKPEHVRVATVDDIDDIMAMLAADIEENATAIAPFNEPIMRETVNAMLADRRSTLVVLENPESQIIGTLGMEMERLIWSDQWFVAERWLFVYPEHRSHKAAADLVNYARWMTDTVSKALGYQTYFVMGLQGTRDMLEKVAFLRRYMAFAGARLIYPPVA